MGKNVNLEEGTAIVTRRTDAKRWKAGCLGQIIKTWSKTLQALDMQGHDSYTNELHAPEVLNLRTCPEHRMHLMLLQNLDIAGG